MAGYVAGGHCSRTGAAGTQQAGARTAGRSDGVSALVPVAPPSRAGQTSATPMPSGLTTPKPVTTTRRGCSVGGGPAAVRATFKEGPQDVKGECGRGR